MQKVSLYIWHKKDTVYDVKLDDDDDNDDDDDDDDGDDDDDKLYVQGGDDRKKMEKSTSEIQISKFDWAKL